ncbi:MAG TPA: transporter substrate-binding domain-containing protein [Phnomibacter sp.]|nr:transporter substrate-binding domain-containing protein [Phnomibacter sp.]
MKRLLLLTLLLATVVGYSQTTTLKLASDVWPPYTDVSSKFALAIDLVREALSRNHVKEQTKILDFTAVITGISKKQFDGSAALWRSPEREKYLLFSEPYLENRLILVGKKGSNVSADSLSQLRGHKVAIVESYAYGAVLNQANGVQIVKGKNSQQNLDRLLKGEVDYILADALLVEYLLKFQSEEVAKFLEIGSNAFVRLPLHFAIRKDYPGAQKIIDSFNVTIKKMIVDGTYNRILKLNWVSTDVDGDGLPELVLSGNKAGTEAPANSYNIMGQPGAASNKNAHYVIEGKLYPDWNSVPGKYKIPGASPATPDKKDFGLIFRF